MMVGLGGVTTAPACQRCGTVKSGGPMILFVRQGIGIPLSLPFRCPSPLCNPPKADQ